MWHKALKALFNFLSMYAQRHWGKCIFKERKQIKLFFCNTIKNYKKTNNPWHSYITKKAVSKCFLKI